MKLAPREIEKIRLHNVSSTIAHLRYVLALDTTLLLVL